MLFAYLFGSQAKEKTGKLSDIDIAVYFDKKISPPSMFDNRLRLITEFSKILKSDKVEVVPLNNAYPLLAHRIIRDGKLLFSCNELERIRFEVRTMSLYFDFKPYLEKYVAKEFAV